VPPFQTICDNIFAQFLLNWPAVLGTRPAVKRNAISPLGAAAAGRAGAKPLNPVEVEAMHLFVQLSRALGQPPSVAEIYGLLFVSPKPLNQDEMINRINLSKGSASQGCVTCWI
jgi:hypothetical protein